MNQSRSMTSSMTSSCRNMGLKISTLLPLSRPTPSWRRCSQNLACLVERAVNQSSQQASSCWVRQACLISTAHSPMCLQDSLVMLQLSLCRMQLLMNLRASPTRSRLLNDTILLKDSTGLEGLNLASSSYSSAENFSAGFTYTSSSLITLLFSESPWVSSPMMSFHITALALLRFSSRLSLRTSLNSFLSLVATGAAAWWVLASGVRQALMTGSRGGTSPACSLSALQKRVWQKYCLVGLKVFSILTSSSKSSSALWYSIILLISSRTTSLWASVDFLRGLKGQSRTSSTVGSSMRQNISLSGVRLGIRTTILGETPFLRLRETQRAMAYLLRASMEQMRAVKSLRPAWSSPGTTMSTSLMRQCRGTLALSTKPRNLRFFSSKTLLPASRRELMGTSWGPQWKALMMFSGSTIFPLSSPCTTQLVSIITSFWPMLGSKGTEASYLANDLSLYLFMALQVQTSIVSPAATSITPLYLATGLVSLFLNFLQSSMAREAGKIWTLSGQSCLRCMSSCAFLSWTGSSSISPSSSLSAGLQLTMKSMGMRLSLMLLAVSLPARVATSALSKSLSPIPLLNTNTLLLYFLALQCRPITPRQQLMQLRMSPPARGFSNLASLSCCTFRTKSTLGFSISCSRRLFPSSVSLSPKSTSPSSWLELLNSFCCSVSLQHSSAIFAREHPSEKASSIELPTSTTSRIAYLDIRNIIANQI